jgi:hypothetical protein
MDFLLYSNIFFDKINFISKKLKITRKNPFSVVKEKGAGSVIKSKRDYGILKGGGEMCVKRSG